MEYSPGGANPAASWVDAGTIDLIRGLGLEIVSSADIFQATAAAWSDAALASHLDACRLVSEVRDVAFSYIRQSIGFGRSITEFDVQELIVSEFGRRNLETENRPIVAVNSHSGNPHYEPTSEHNALIRTGDWILVDLWARHPGHANVFADMTWVAYAGAEVPPRHRQIFDVVKSARDTVIRHLASAWERGERVQGWQLDRLARDRIAGEGFGDYFVHRTGHSIGPGGKLHALGANLDDYDTHDTRAILPRAGFSIEPGVYLPEFGVRLEVNAYMDPQRGPRIPTPTQDDVVLLL